MTLLNPPSILLEGGNVPVVDYWKLEATISSHPELWGWRDKSCAISGCNQDVVQWDQVLGYRCGAHRT